MDYISVRAAAENWGISERRVQKLCEQGRVPGAQRFGHSWMIPKDTHKPEDKRLTPKKEQAEETRPTHINEKKPLSMLRRAWELKTHGKMEEFDALLNELLPLVKAHEDDPELYGE